MEELGVVDYVDSRPEISGSLPPIDLLSGISFFDIFDVPISGSSHCDSER